jgi:cytochrome c-type biogenesis protein CcmH/NrfF
MIQEMMQFEKIQDIPENMVENFGETLLMTPELNSQINKLVLKKFE